MKKEKLKRIARRITAFAAAAAMAATLAFPTGTELLGINFGTSVVASAETTTDGNFDYTVNENTVTITKYNGSGGEVEIPATIGGNTVTSIGAEAFKDCTSLTSVAIPDGVSSIGAEAFFGCSSLRSITIPGSVTSIGGYAFHSCTSLESINIPDSVTKIDAYTFTRCTSLSVITIPKNVTSIEKSSFMGCSVLSSINVAGENTKYCSVEGVLFDKNKTELLFYPANKDGTSYAIPDGVTTIESYAFYENNNLVSITIPDGVIYIGAGAFNSCKKLTSVSIPASVNNIGIEAFNSCESLTAISVHENNSVYSSENGVLFDKNKTILFVYPAEKSEKSYTVPNTVKHINSFTGCVNLENITLNEGVENIDLAAFMGCTNLKSINIPSSVTAIGDRAFMSCTSLETINIPSTVTTIGDQAFMLCTSLTEISVHADNSNYSSVDNVLFDKNKTTLIVYPGGKSDTSYSVPSSVTSVSSTAFLMCPNLESIAFPPSVTSFGYSVISGCKKLASVFVPEKAAFTNQIDPAEMFTSEVRYAVSDDKANITGIELGTGQTTVDIPETICGYTVASVLPSQWEKVGKHTHKLDGTNTCGLCGVDRSSRFDITIKEPSAGKALATQASVICNTTKENCDIIWKPAPTDGIAAYGTAYTASVTISSGSTPVVTINGEAVDSSNITANVDGTFTVKHTFDATEKRTLTASDFSFAAPSDLVYNGSAKEAAFTTAVSGAGDITVKYYDDNGTKLDSAPVNAGTYTVKIDVAAGAECAAANELTDSTWTFTIKRAAVTVTAKDYKVKLGDSLPAKLEYETDGLIGTDTLASIGANVTIGYANAGTPSAIGNYTIVVSGAENTTNYELNYVNGSLTIISKKPQEITAADVTLTYGDAGKKIGAATSGDGAITYAVKTGEDVISIVADGTITALKAGTATVEITAAETDDYAKATKTITVTVNKATPTVTAPTATAITYGQALSASTLSDTNWSWVDGTVIPTVQNNGYAAKMTVNDNNYDYSGVEGYNSETHTVTRAIAVTVNPATPVITVTANPDSAITEKATTVTVTAEAKNPNNDSLNDVPTPQLSYKIGNGAETPINGGTFVIPANTPNGTIFTIIAGTPATAGYSVGTGTTTITVADCTHPNVLTTWKNDATHHWHECPDCGAEVDKAEHTSNAPATETSPEVCNDCGYEMNPALGHIHANHLTPVSEVPETCTTDGVKAHYECDCGKLFADDQAATEVTADDLKIAAHHSYGTDWVSDNDDDHYHLCSVCGDKTDITAHSYDDGVITTEPTEQTTGIKTYTCSECNHTKTEIVPKLNHTHSLATEYSSDATGHWYACSGCTEKVDFEAHTEDSGTVTVEPTETTEGVKTFKCTKCEYVIRTETIAVLDHTHVPSDEYSKDETGHWHTCSGCTEQLDFAAHTYGKWKITVPAAAEANGKKERSCTVCGYVQEGTVIYGGDETTGDMDNATDPENNACHADLELTDEEIIEKIPLTPEELEAIENGADLEVYMVVIDYSGNVPSADKTLAEKILSGDMQMGMYIDVTLFVKVGDNDPRAVTNTNGELKITFEMPEKLINTDKDVTREYSIIRVHSGEAAILDCAYDNATGKGSFKTDKFSSYAIAYRDIEEEEPTPEPEPEPEKVIYYPVITSGNVVADKSYAAAGQTVNVKASFGYDIIVTAENGRQIAKMTEKGSFTMPASKVYVTAIQNETFALMANAWNQSYVYSYDADMNKIKVNSTKKRGVIVVNLGEEYAGRTFTIYSGRKSTKVKVTEGVLDEKGKFVFEVPDGKNYTLVVED